MVAGEARHATWREWADWSHSEQEKVDSLFICSALMPDKADVTTTIHAQPKLTPPTHVFFPQSGEEGAGQVKNSQVPRQDRHDRV